MAIETSFLFVQHKYGRKTKFKRTVFNSEVRVALALNKPSQATNQLFFLI